MTNVAEWLAPLATMLAAIMTAANFGARVTGWGFVVFTIGSIGWIVVGLGSGQNSLIITNIFLAAINAIGVWRWLGRQARYESVGEAAESAGEAAQSTSVVAASSLVGRDIVDAEGNKLGEAVEAILERDNAVIHHLVARFGGIGGIGEQIVALPLADIRLLDKVVCTRLSGAQMAALPRIDASKWPRLLDETAPVD